jgi:hypothetical protein
LYKDTNGKIIVVDNDIKRPIFYNEHMFLSIKTISSGVKEKISTKDQSKVIEKAQGC